MFIAKDYKSQKKLANKLFGNSFVKNETNPNPIYTSVDLCEQILSKIDLQDKIIMVMYNPEFVWVLKKKYNICMDNVVLWTREYEGFNNKFAEEIGCIYLWGYLWGEVNVKFDVVLANPPYDNTLHLDFLDFATDISNEVVFLHPAGYLLAESSKNRSYKKILDKIDGHVSSVKLNDPKSWFPNIALNGQQLAIVNIDMSKTFNEVEVSYLQLDKIIKLKSLRDINTFGNNPVYDSFKSKVLNACESLSLKDVFERNTKKQFSIEIGDLSNYCFFGELKGKGGGGGLRKVEENKSFNGVSFYNRELAEAAFSYLKNPIAILALHIAKKNFHVHPSMHTTPWFNDKESFLNPAKALNLSQEEIDFCQEVYNDSGKYFKF